MADRPRGNGGPEDGTPEYNWLYGRKGKAGASEGGDPDATRAVPRQPRPDETRVMPTSPRRRRSPPPARDRRPGPRLRRPLPRRARRAYVAWLPPAAVPAALDARAAPALAGLPRRRARVRVDQGREGRRSSRSGNRPDDQPGTTYLLVGSDSRAGLSAEERKDLGTGNAQGQRTDTIMLLHTGSGPNLLMSIPRDSLVEVPGPRDDQDQLGVRVRRPEAAGAHDRGRHGDPGRRLRRDRPRRGRRGRRRRGRHRRSARPRT